jgi:hypothetical protein
MRVLFRTLTRLALCGAVALMLTCQGTADAQSPNPSLPRPISDAQFTKILADIVSHGTARTIPSQVTTALGLTHKAESLTAPQLAYLETTSAYNDKTNHTIAKLGNGNYLLANTNPDRPVGYIFYVDGDLGLIRAVQQTAKGIATWPKEDAQKALEVELTFYAGIGELL